MVPHNAYGEALAQRYDQYIFIAKGTNTVIVITSADEPMGLEENPLLSKLFRASAGS